MRIRKKLIYCIKLDHVLYSINYGIDNNSAYGTYCTDRQTYPRVWHAPKHSQWSNCLHGPKPEGIFCSIAQTSKGKTSSSREKFLSQKSYSRSKHAYWAQFNFIKKI